MAINPVLYQDRYTYIAGDCIEDHGVVVLPSDIAGLVGTFFYKVEDIGTDALEAVGVDIMETEIGEILLGMIQKDIGLVGRVDNLAFTEI